jgi:hypothetical protein
MLHFQQKLPDFNPVVAGGRASVRVPKGPTYREFVLAYKPDGTKATKAVMIADIEEVVLKINGIAKQTYSGEDLVVINEFYEENGFTDGELVIPLSRHWARTIQGEENLCWGTKDIDNLFLEVKLASGATNPQLSCEAFFTPDSRDLGLIVEVHKVQVSSSVAGKVEISDLAKENGSLLALHMKSADITACELKVDRAYVIESETNLEIYQNRLKRVGGRNPQAGWVHIDTMHLNRVDDAVPLLGAQDFRVKPTLSNAGAIPIIMETLNIPFGQARG